jgi:hypothetical protein
MRLLAWTIWQILTLVFALLVWANLFGEYGRYRDTTASMAALIVALSFALVTGTIIPWRRWRAADRARQATEE